MTDKSLETQIQYKLIEKLTSINKSLEEEIEVRKQREEELIVERKKLSDLLNEKDLLLRELTHRVKNNLQLIDSLLALQINRLGDPLVSSVLEDYRSRIHSIAEMFVLLSGSKNDDKITLRIYLGNLLEAILNDVDINIECDELDVYFEKLTSLGMVIHELATNSFKYAWTKGEGKQKKVFLKVHENDGVLKVVFSDNGNTGVHPEDLVFDFGMELIELLVDNNSVEYTVTQGGGLTVSFNYKL